MRIGLKGEADTVVWIALPITPICLFRITFDELSCPSHRGSCFTPRSNLIVKFTHCLQRVLTLDSRRALSLPSTTTQNSRFNTSTYYLPWLSRTTTNMSSSSSLKFVCILSESTIMRTGAKINLPRTTSPRLENDTQKVLESITYDL